MHLHTDDDIPLATEDSDEWVDVPRPITLTPVPKGGVSSDGAIVLWLPSSIPTKLHSSCCVNGLAAKEIILRVADCSDCLHNIQHCLHELSLFSDYKSRNVDEQHVQTRALGTLKALRDKHDHYVARYRHSRMAWLALDPKQQFEGGKWKRVLRALRQKDLTYPGDDEVADADIDSDDKSEDEAADQPAHTKHSANSVGNNPKKRRGGKGYNRTTWIWRVQRQDGRNIPSLSGTSTEEDVNKRKIFLSMRFDCTNIHF